MSKLNVSTEDAVAQFKKLAEAIVNFSNVSGKGAKNVKFMQDQINAMGAAARKQVTILNKGGQAIKSNTTAVKANTTAAKQNNTVKKQSVKTNKSLGLSMKDLLKSYGLIRVAQLAWMQAVKAFNLAKTFDGFRLSLEKTTGSLFEAASAQRFLMQISVDFGVSLVSTTDRYIKFSTAAKQAGLSVKQTEDIFRSMTKAGALLGLQTDELKGIYLALEQMLSKGKVTTEELRRQLGERLPGALGIMAASIGVTTAELDKMLKKGEIISAEVLPGFAEAVEVAYGITTLETVETLTSAQNRMTTAWQSFVKSVTEDESVLKNAMKGILEGVAGAFEKFELFFGSDNASRERDTRRASKLTADSITKQAQLEVNLVVEKNKELEKLEKQFSDNTNKILKSSDEEKIEQLNATNAIIMKDIIEFNNQVKAAEKRIARERFDDSLEAFEKAKAALSQRDAEIEGVEGAMNVLMADPNADTSGMGKLVDLLDDLTNGTGRYKKSLDQLAASASVAEGRFDVIRKLLQPNRSLDPDEGGGSSKVDTSDLDATIARFKKLQEQYKQIANSTEESYQVRLDAQEQFVIFSNGINNAQFEKDIRLAKDNENKKQQAIAKLNLADLKLKKKAKEQEAKLIESFINDELKEIEAAAKAKIDAEVAIIKTKYKLLGALTIEQEKEMQRQITAFTNKVNDKKLEDQSAAINDFLNLMGIEGELKIELTRKIQEILSKISEAGRRNDIEAFKFHLEDLRELVLNIADIGDALFERKIENIDAEIKAEEDKYDKLINLAKDDVAQREALEEEKQLTIEKLEKKRLKVEQNQARVRKAAAIAEIAINVAIGVSKAWTKGAFLGGLESALIIANGVLQTAAVLATPIPQYKEGLERADKDHIAMINDGGRQEYIKRNGKILTTTKKDAIVGIQKGDTVYKSYEDMKNKILLTSALSNGQALNEGQFNNLLTGISGAIKEGWKEAKITNRLRLNNSGSNNDAYKQAQSRWN